MRARALVGPAMALAYVALALLHTRIYDDFATRCYGGGRGDPGQHGWALARVTSQLLSEPWRPFEGNVYYPARHSVLFGDPLLGPAVLVLPLRALGADAVLLYNAAILLSLVVTSWGCFRLARRMGAVPVAAFLAGLVVPYAGQQLVRLWHLNLLAIPFLPWLLLELIELIEAPRWGAALRAGLAFALQAATSGYHAFGVAITALVVAAWGFRRLRDARLLGWGSLAAAVAVIATYPYVSGFVQIGHEEARLAREIGIARANGLDLSSLLVSGSWAWSWLLPGGQPFFPGLVPLLLAGRALLEFRRDRYVRLLALLALATLLMALGPEVRWRGSPLGPGPFALAVRWVPLLDAMRHPYTLAVPGLMAVGLLAALGLSASSLSRRPRVAAGLLALAVAETLTDAPARRPAPRELPGVYTELARLAAGEAQGGKPWPATLELPFRDSTYTWWAGFHGLPIVNGVGAFEPARYQGLWQQFQREWKGAPRDLHESRSVEYLKTWFPARFVLVHARRGGSWRAFADASPRSFVLLSETAAGERIYLLRRGGRGAELARGFRDDQLRSGRIALRLAASHPGRLEATLAGLPLGAPEPVGLEPRQIEWPVPPGLVRPGLNLLELRLAGAPGAVLELEDVWTP